MVFRLGAVYRVRVKEVTESGLIVTVGNNRTGFIPVVEMTGDFPDNPRLFFRRNDRLQAMLVVKSPDERRLVFSLKALASVQGKPSTHDEERKEREPEFDNLFQKFKRDSQWRLSLWKQSIETKRKRGRS